MPKRTDANQQEIVMALRQNGRMVQDLHEVGRGVPDLLVGTPSGRLVLLEVKAPGGRVNEREFAFLCRWERYPVHVVRCVDEALEVTR